MAEHDHNKYAIDGLFLSQRITGIQRYAYEIVLELDKIVGNLDIVILVPHNAKNIPCYKNIEVIRIGKLQGIPWEQIEFPYYARKSERQCICFANVVPLIYAKGIAVIHDVGYKANPQFYISVRDRAAAVWHRIHYWCVAHSKMQIVTVSNFSKSEIMKYYKMSSDRITVIYNAWQHMKRIHAANDTFDRFSELKKGEYLFSMSTLAPNKNFKWILYAARNNPDEQFAIAGGNKLKGIAEAAGLAHLPNIRWLGYVSDEDAKTLMKNCKAFLFPTLYEGFGIPPLEALACGAPEILVSDIPCMREIYGAYVNYIDPIDYKVNEINKKKQINVIDALKKYEWKASAQKLIKLMKKNTIEEDVCQRDIIAKE